MDVQQLRFSDQGSDVLEDRVLVFGMSVSDSGAVRVLRRAIRISYEASWNDDEDELRTSGQFGDKRKRSLPTEGSAGAATTADYQTRHHGFLRYRDTNQAVGLALT